MIIVIAFVGLIVGVMWFLGAWLGPKKTSPVKMMPFECGMEPFETPGDRFGVKFYLIAILFVIFDIDLAQWPKAIAEIRAFLDGIDDALPA